jgi:SAM-dependent methyltransferase
MRLAPRYNQWIFTLVKPYLGCRIFEIGAGIGNLTQKFVAVADFVFSIEPNQICYSDLVKTLGLSPKFESRPWRLEDCDVKLLHGYLIDTVICINVLEHIENDHQALIKIQEILQPSGRLVLFVPAITWAYGPIDSAVGHFRRYDKGSLLRELIQSGFNIEIIRYSNFIGLMGWLYNAHFRRNTRQSDGQIKFFNRLIPWYSRLEKLISPPIGMSLLSVGWKGT